MTAPDTATGMRSTAAPQTTQGAETELVIGGVTRVACTAPVQAKLNKR